MKLLQVSLAMLCAVPVVPQSAAAASPPLADCTCRMFGADVPLGAELCIVTPQGRRLAVCVREQNVTSWRAGSESCEELSLLDEPRR